MTFKCPVCRDNFYTQDHLETHLAYHHNAMTTRDEENYLFCPAPGCRTVVMGSSRMNRHFVQAHNGDLFLANGEQVPLLNCTEPGCNVRFLSKSSRAGHRRGKHPVITKKRSKSRSGSSKATLQHYSDGKSILPMDFDHQGFIKELNQARINNNQSSSEHR